MPRIRNVRRRNFAASLAALAVARAALQPADAQTAPFAMQLGSNAADDVTPVLWAQHSGMFAKAGLSIDIQKFTSGSAVTAASRARSNSGVTCTGRRPPLVQLLRKMSANRDETTASKP